MDAFRLWILVTFFGTAYSIHPDCAIISEHMKAQEACIQIQRTESQNQNESMGCGTGWDGIQCWPRAELGQVVNLSCADILQLLTHTQGYVFRNCTKDGWSDVHPAYNVACDFGDEPEYEMSYFSTFRRVYTAGYATSLVSLISAIFVFAAFRKFHCTRNYIHINLFASFIMRASAVFIKDAVLFTDETLDHCFMSTIACKSAVAFFQFCIMANYFWLLVEGVYLQSLLALTFVSQSKYFWWYIITGWGVPSIVLTIWVISRNFYDNRGCWDDTENPFIWWIIKGPITASLLVNFLIFVNVMRILVQKLRSPAVGGSDTGNFMRLAKSTLFLIPLFGMHYTVFAFLPEDTGGEARLYIELGLGSFQGFVVALLYCFLNGEVQAELKRRLYKWHTQNRLSPTRHRITLTQISILEKPDAQMVAPCPAGVTPI
ncbi:growth hormone releasing hormone receptor a [Clupea harengus]|uniref:Growth hormone releasing hormone receptor a n=1 Tax=Clupea harengus TaxID=7950 RepID=A0A6P8EW61_CLUHA|nr:growth hormone releasing hormone receptor a [Clupea harengus]